MEVQEHVPLAPLTTLGVGGPARRFLRVTNESELGEALRFAAGADLPTFVLGGGSNLVVADSGLDVFVIHLAMRGLQIMSAGEGGALLRAAAGEPWDDVVAAAVAEGLAGIECLSGIPGLTGATPIQNVGAYGQEVSDTITKVVVVDRATGEKNELRPNECAFAYRDSAFKRWWRGRFVVVSIELALSRGAPERPRYAELARAMGEDPCTPASLRAKVIELRTSKAMVYGTGGPDDRSVGSFFMNPIVSPYVADAVEGRARGSGAMREDEKMPRFQAASGNVKLAAGWLIERAGFSKGTARGSVGLSSRHALAIVNRGGATASDVVSFARWVRDGVMEKFGVRLVPEPELVGFKPDELGDLTGC